MGTGDAVTAAVLLGAAVWLLWRSLFRAKGRCHGCSSGCAPGRSADVGDGLVRLGRGVAARRPAGSGRAGAR